MSEARFTKGEWEQSHRKGVDGMYSTEVYDQHGETICTLAWHVVDEGNGVRSTDREANAHLIKTAPKMYKFLESLQLDVSNDHVRDELLAEARGEK